MRLILRRAPRASLGPVALAFALLLVGNLLDRAHARESGSPPADAWAAVPGEAPDGRSAASGDLVRSAATAPEPRVAKVQRPGGRIDPALQALATQKARPLVLTSADGERQCPVILKAEPAGAGFDLAFDRPVCEPAIAFLAEVTAWIPELSGAVRLLNAQGRTVAEFTEAAGGSYEALKEGDGVYFLSDPSIQEGGEVTVAEVTGDWDLSVTAGKPLCRWTLSDAPAPKGAATKAGPAGKAASAAKTPPGKDRPAPSGQAVTVAPGCDAGMARLEPVSWRLEGGNILVVTRAGLTIRFARQEDGGWARVPERSRPLLMTRP